MDEALRYATAAELRAWYAVGEVSPTEFIRATLDLLDACEPALHAFLTVTADLALAQAATAERLIHSLGDAAWEDRPLLGVPATVKDLIPTEGIRTTRGSLRHAGWVPDRDAPAVARLRRAGAVLIGKTTTSEFGWSAGTVNMLAPPAANPWDPTRSAGGSSGGAAAATAAGVGIAALGTDGAGSIRVPAAFCGVVGFKPTFGLIPYAPLSPEGLSHVGPLARDVATVGLLTQVLAGPDPDDPFSMSLPPQRPMPARAPRIGWLRWGGPVCEVEAVARTAAHALGGSVQELDVPFADPYPHLVTILAAFEAAGQKAAGQADDELSDPARLRVVEHGRRLRAADLARAQAERLRLTRCLDRVMERCDVLAMPTVWVEPFAVGAWRPGPPSTADDLDWLAWCRAAYPFNLTGQPAISVPAGSTVAGYPVGLQLVGRRHEDRLLLQVAGQFEHARPWRHGYSGKDRQQR
jgi:aspartyl-tRNA(Asn)/glutamyl-tRNA(Gln) amidotransferase subunit A